MKHKNIIGYLIALIFLCLLTKNCSAQFSIQGGATFASNSYETFYQCGEASARDNITPIGCYEIVEQRGVQPTLLFEYRITKNFLSIAARAGTGKYYFHSMLTEVEAVVIPAKVIHVSASEFLDLLIEGLQIGVVAGSDSSYNPMLDFQGNFYLTPVVALYLPINEKFSFRLSGAFGKQSFAQTVINYSL